MFFHSRSGHDLIAGAGARCQHAVVANLVGSGRWDEGDQPLQQLVALHQDVRRAVAPAGLETQGESAVGLHFEAIVRERRARDIAAEPLESATVSRWDGDVGVEAHAIALRDPGRRFGVGARVLGFEAITQASPSLAGVRARRDAGAERCGGERGEEGLVSGEGVVVALGARREQPRDAAADTAAHLVDCVLPEAP